MDVIDNHAIRRTVIIMYNNYYLSGRASTAVVNIVPIIINSVNAYLDVSPYV